MTQRWGTNNGIHVTNTTYKTNNPQTKNCNRGTALERSVEKLLGGRSLNPVWLARNLVLYSVAAVQIYVRSEYRFSTSSVKNHSETHVIINTASKQSRSLDDYLKSEHKKNTNRNTMGQYHLNQHTTNSTMRPLWPAKTQISLYIHPGVSGEWMCTIMVNCLED